MTALALDQARLGQPQRKKKSKYALYDQLHRHIHELGYSLFTKFQERKMTVDELFLKVRHLIHVFNNRPSDRPMLRL